MFAGNLPAKGARVVLKMLYRIASSDGHRHLGLVVAVEDWLAMDHEERLVRYGARFSVIERTLKGVSGVKATKVAPVNNFVGLLLHVIIDTL